MRSMTYGVMPSREEFDAACLAHDADEPPEACVANLGFGFENDKRVGSDRFTPDELWNELQKAFTEYQESSHREVSEKAGDWCSSVLGQLGFEWV